MRVWQLMFVVLVGLNALVYAIVYFRGRALRSQTAAPREREPIRREFPARHVPRDQVPRPLPRAEDAVGGIESITIDGKRYWFGFSFSADAVLSPLIDDPKVMAQFASDYMLQRDTEDAERREIACPPEYWDKLVEEAIHGSDLTDSSERDFAGHELSRLRAQLHEARRTARPVEMSTPPNRHLVCLLDAAGDWRGGPEDAAIEDALNGLASGDWFEGALSVVSGASPPPPGTTFEDAVDVLTTQLEHWQTVVPENWSSLLLGR